MRKIDFLKRTAGRYIGVTYTRYGKTKNAAGKVLDLNSKRVLLEDSWGNNHYVPTNNIIVVRHNREEVRF